MGEAGMVSTPKGKQLLIEELWKPAGSGLAFWEACGIE
jgi:translation initiation factor 2D